MVGFEEERGREGEGGGEGRREGEGGGEGRREGEGGGEGRREEGRGGDGGDGGEAKVALEGEIGDFFGVMVRGLGVEEEGDFVVVVLGVIVTGFDCFEVSLPFMEGVACLGVIVIGLICLGTIGSFGDVLGSSGVEIGCLLTSKGSS